MEPAFPDALIALAYCYGGRADWAQGYSCYIPWRAML